MTTTYPFSAVVGMDDLALALCLCAVHPRIGGVLVRGEKGTAKSTMVRALAAVLPPLETVAGCRFSCDPLAPDAACPDGPHPAAADGTGARRPVRLVELPLGASEDRVVGSLHLDRLVAHGEVAFDPGLLAQANRGILYVDEVNLLPDHLVDTLLDAAAMGRVQVEREAVSVSHAASFVLVGTMNPEEGELRPQLLDRFGLAVDVVADREPGRRVEVVRRRLAFEADPVAFAADHAAADAALAQRIADAREHVAKVTLPDSALVSIAEVCAAYDLDGLRGDIVMARTAVAHAAWSGRDVVGPADVRAAARLALPHRRRRSPFDSQGEGGDGSLEEVLDRHAPPDDEPEPPDGPGPQGPDRRETGTPAQDDAGPSEAEAPGQDESPPGEPGPGPGPRTRGQAAGDPYAARLLQVRRAGRGVAGRRSLAVTAVGRHVRDVLPGDPRGQGVSVVGSVRASVRRQAAAAGRNPGLAGPVRLTGADLRRSLRLGREGNLVVFAVDTSGSMGAARRVREVKTAVVSLLLDAYQRRDKVAVVAFGGRTARVVLPPTSSVERAERLLAEVPTGGRTPLAEGLAAARELVAREQARDPDRRPLVLLLTDGRATSGPDALRRALATAERSRLGHGEWVVLDCEATGPVRLGLARAVAAALGADCLDLGEVAAARLAGTVRGRRPGRPTGRRVA
ncbi:MAG TPA: VWA domain-containing protein [Intrasporangium sp.]|uniref:VWA domain-containing protein n=1 Tax=Intrasporangium sp. TaxID=1925024 RepID=UPI002D7801C5|nr:VWA domain-containing protein [Intrasporangium sp.]HET7399632.1 VWA domain-containing protein [Intrasporangium sp.]